MLYYLSLFIDFRYYHFNFSASSVSMLGYPSPCRDMLAFMESSAAIITLCVPAMVCFLIGSCKALADLRAEADALQRVYVWKRRD